MLGILGNLFIHPTEALLGGVCVERDRHEMRGGGGLLFKTAWRKVNVRRDAGRRRKRRRGLVKALSRRGIEHPRSDNVLSI